MKKPSLVIAIGKMKPRGMMPHKDPILDREEEGEGEHDEEEELDPGVIAAMEDFADALKHGDHEGMAKAFTYAFHCAEKEPHEEYPHDEDDEGSGY